MARCVIAAIALTATMSVGSGAMAQPAAGPPGSATTPAEKLAPQQATHPAGTKGGRMSHHGSKAGVAANTGAGSKGGNLGATTSRSTGTTPAAGTTPQ